MLAFSNDYYGMIFRATQSVELFCAYHEVAGTVRRIDIVNRIIVITGNEKAADGVTVKLEDVVNISGEVFADIERSEYSGG